MGTISTDILLVEDNATDLELPLRALNRNKKNSKIAVARDGSEALEFLLFGDKSIINMNYSLPKNDNFRFKTPEKMGLEVLETIKSNKRTKNIPVVVFTSYKEEKDLIACYRLGVNSYTVKPVEFRDFTKTVCKLANYWIKYNRLPNLIK